MNGGVILDPKEPRSQGGGEGDLIAGRYRVIAEIGRGGMGVVFRAHDEKLRRDVAVKTLSAVDDKLARRFAREAKGMASLVHPNIVHVLDAGTEGTPPFYVMELLAGKSLAAMLREAKRFDVPRAVEIVLEILSALEHAHRTFVHRDIKPANVFLVGEDERVKLLDFGIAKALDDDGVRTTTGSLLGTPVYMAPEQLLCKPVDARTDLHAVGAILFELIVGRRAFFGGGPGEIAAAILHQVPPDLATLRTDVPPAVAAVVARALAKDPHARFSSAREMADALRAARPAPIAAAKPTAPAEEPARSKVLMFLGAAGASIVVASIVAGVVLLRMSRVPAATPSSTIVPPSSPPIVSLEAGTVELPSPPPTSTLEARTSASASARAPAKPRLATKATLEKDPYSDTLSSDELAVVAIGLLHIEACAAKHPGELVAGDQLLYRVSSREVGTTAPSHFEMATTKEIKNNELWKCLDDAGRVVPLKARQWGLRWYVNLE